MTEMEADAPVPGDEVAHLQERLIQETERLTKLFDAYEEQHKELLDTRAEIEVLEREIIEKEIEREGVESLLRDKDDRYRDLETDLAKSNKRLEYYDIELPKMEEKYTREKERLGRVFELAEELDDDLRLAVAEMKARDDWYIDHMQLFEDLNKAIKQRYDMVEAAVETERKSQHRRRAFDDQIASLVEMRAAEMTIDQAEQTLVDSTPAVEETDDAMDESADTEVPESVNSDDVSEVINDESESEPESSKESSDGEGVAEDVSPSVEEQTYSESVLSRVMTSYSIPDSDKDEFLSFAQDYDHDNNGYLKSSELEDAAKAWSTKSE
ncbi:MAG: hypothetical protein CL992_00035 [Euryarchaeota archaeon]|nr:hypothetical protein [Euryarchaeota archaeon]